METMPIWWALMWTAILAGIFAVAEFIDARNRKE